MAVATPPSTNVEKDTKEPKVVLIPIISIPKYSKLNFLVTRPTKNSVTFDRRTALIFRNELFFYS